MAVHYSEELIDSIKQANSIIDVASQYFDLHKVGSIYQANCKHGDRETRSLTFYPKTNSFYCFGCQAGHRDVTGSSDVIAFVMWVEDISWNDAVIYLADRAGIKLPTESLSPEDIERAAAYEKVAEQNRKYWKELNQNQELKQYFADKGITTDDIGRWRLGADGNRPVYAIIDEMGRTCAFSKRRPLNEDTGPKYRNSNESIIFKKGNILYGLHNIKGLIRKEGYIVLVEGFNDVILLQKYGVPAVGLMGTALTDEQIRLIKKYTNTVIIFLDGDEGGYENTWRIINLLQREEIMVKVLSLPGFDPDDIARAKQEGIRNYILSEATLACQFKVNRLINKYNEEITVAAKRTISALQKVLSQVEDPVERDLCISQVANALGVRRESIIDLLM